MESADADGAVIKLETGESLKVPVTTDGLASGAELTLGVRPEHMHPVDDDTSEQVIRRKVRAVENFGEYSHLYLNESTETPIIAKVAEDVLKVPEKPMAFFVKPAACHLFDADGEALDYLPSVPGPHELSSTDAV
nr:TOBE domain-containing protein [Marinicella sp. W31]MDC2878524.1 TOBE domain-containing protein [Marinicella sp. W31]